MRAGTVRAGTVRAGTVRAGTVRAGLGLGAAAIPRHAGWLGFGAGLLAASMVAVCAQPVEER
ncbi:hypothetical protein Airi01_050140 [Actinoallomurus iriomotensis]|uniref:Uncharacterized protein n=1 Tax=Actinoallomurus iriomotensis TaxID=478107 RepID=A0A9W6VRQ5_9ACTN|nr:hypothetical protein Airi01_050140 [Actinoallomurus iriomotensis]